MGRTISFEQAESMVLATLLDQAPRAETVSLLEAPGRVLAEDLYSDVDVPPFDKSAMDGFACRREDLGRDLVVLETVAAGQLPSMQVGPGQCTRIMTGASLPVGADMVFKVEDSQVVGESDVRDGQRVRFVGSDSAANICLRGEDMVRGQMVLEAGTALQVRHLALLASVGAAQVKVARRPTISVLATGDELVEPHVVPGAGQIRNSNAYQLAGQITRAGAVPLMGGTAPDSTEGLTALVKEVADGCDMLLLSGGASVGDFDLVPKVLEGLGVRFLFNSVSIKPGKPTTFGMWGPKPVWCLPGNPVSTFVIFELFVRRYIQQWMGCKRFDSDPTVTLESDFSRKRAERAEWVPVEFTEGGLAKPIVYHGSAHFFAISRASGLICVPQGVTHIESGSRVTVRQI